MKKLILGLTAASLCALTPITSIAGEWTKFDEGYQAYTSKQYDRAHRILRPLAESGDDDAQLWLGQMYASGNGVKKSPEQALYWYGKSWEKGNYAAKVRIDKLTAQGYLAAKEPIAIKVPVTFETGYNAFANGDYARAMEIFRPMAERGQTSAADKVGYMYEHGKGVTSSYEQAIYWYEKSLQGFPKNAAKIKSLKKKIKRGELNNKTATPPLINNASPEALNKQAKAFYDASDFIEAAKLYRMSADKGNAQAQFQLGSLYKLGWGMKKSPKQAAYWYEKSALQGHSLAQFYLAGLYRDGRGVPQSTSQALYWYKKSAQQNQMGAQKNINKIEGKMVLDNGLAAYNRGDYTKAFTLLSNTIKTTDDAKAHMRLGEMYEYGRGTERNKILAEEHYSKVGTRLPGAQAKARILQAEIDKARSEEESVQLLASVQRDLYNVRIGTAIELRKQGKDKQAFDEFIELAREGDVRSQNITGNNYKNGRGVTQSYTEAIKWYKTASDNEKPQFFKSLIRYYKAEAEISLALLYMEGEGVPQDNGKSAFWVERAAQHGNKKAQNVVGDNYYAGIGTTKNKVMAVYWYKKAALQGVESAQYKLAELYRFGEGTPVDKQRAIMWYKKAAAQGHERAAQAIKEYGVTW